MYCLGLRETSASPNRNVTGPDMAGSANSVRARSMSAASMSGAASTNGSSAVASSS